MKTIMKFFKCSMVILMLILSSCSPEDGVDGALGPQGTPGIDGINGQDGNANVVSVLFEDQTIDIGTNIFVIPELTQEILDTGFVYAYVTVTGNDYWEPLPISQAQLIILELDSIALGEISLMSTFTQSGLKVRFVLGEGIDVSGIDFSNFEEVQAFYDF
ncbi:MAG: hypothetical protein COA50_15130 [Flavobacteriaceae bacterium]|nr:MAG: hypothetical protein COA50_15130 [Flavobacteriaceae bacterium]